MAVDSRFFRALVKEKNERDLVGQLKYARKMVIKEGREEVARYLKARGLDVQLIVDTTGLSEAEVAAL